MAEDGGKFTAEERTKLRRNLATRFNLDELRSLCFDLGVDYENLPQTKDSLARELILYCERRSRIPELVQSCRELRPEEEWGPGGPPAQPKVQGAVERWRAGQLTAEDVGVLLAGLQGQQITVVNTGGGAYVAGNVNTGGGDFVGRDRMQPGAAPGSGQAEVALPAPEYERLKADVYNSCFISYSSRDQGFAEKLYEDLRQNGVTCWFAPEDLRIGDKIRPAIDRAIREHGKLLLVLSKDSVTSDWVEAEVESALARERQEKRLVLFPIRIDDAVLETDQGWPALVRNTRMIGDFRRWREPDGYEQALRRLLRDLQQG